MKTVEITLEDIKSSDGWYELMYDLRFKKFKLENPELDEDDASDKFYDEEISSTFKWGDFGTITIEVDENLNIVSGFIHKTGN